MFLDKTEINANDWVLWRRLMDRQRAIRFQPGQSSNPTGRPPLVEATVDAQLRHRQRRTRETVEVEARLAVLEEAMGLGGT
jgi:hypothetical protein